MEEDRYVQNPPTQDLNHEDEVIDTLSLSDLMIYDNNGGPQDFYRLNDQNPSEFDDQFEFSSELLKTSVINNSVVFCGKIIPYKEHIASPNTYKLESKTSHKQRWRFVRVFKKSSKSKSNIHSETLDLKFEVPIRRVSNLASASKPRWYLLMFGFGSSSFSAHMHIRDLKKRQTSVGAKDRRDGKRSGGNGGGIGSWRLLKFLGCGGGDGGRGGGGGDNHHPTAIKELE
ncbi:hypothetical protein L1987_24960 [Smallanthus sonchifolius]|uniref:Uncharacterized protein n=1 Tax=Smallanthus sonchifolius TaxID=185202 RepID=A0ACB9IND5_9ASTR|nr:hypothetical protein L1987_24960 [Smallanthus sonchifolius]